MTTGLADREKMTMSEDTKTTTITPFKRCTSCSTEWRTRDDFLSDPDVTLIGYQAHFIDLNAGLLLFNHSCRTTLAIAVEGFLDLYDGPVFRERATGGPDCRGYCLRRSELGSCPTHCECAYVRAILQIVSNWQKRKAV